nr:hypothetical protein [Tanacetum cinerariifolium]
LNAKTLNVKSVSAICDKCVLIDKHNMCVLNSVAKPLKETVASESNNKPKNFTRKLYERVSKTCSWWYPKFTPSGYIWKPKSRKENVSPNLIEIVLFIVDSGCSKHMTGNLKLLINFVEKFMETVKFRNDHIINDQKPSVKFFHIFGFVCYIVRDGENLDKMKEKGDECIFVGYSNQSRAYRVFNKRTRVIMESIHVNFDELPQLASDQNSSDPAPECQTMALNHDSLSPAIQRQANVSQADRTVKMSNELDLLFSPMFDELLNGSSNFDELPQLASDQNSSDPAPECQTMALNHDSLSPAI